MNINGYIKKKRTKSMEEQVRQYSGMNEEQLMHEMFKVAEQSRKDGTLNNEALDRFFSNAQSFLTPEQSERMKELITELKK